jgi:hypothetical protein
VVSYKLFIDDERFPVTDDWVIVRTSQDAIAAVQERGFPTFISFDHDLGGDDTSILFINWLTDELIDERIQIPSDFDYYVHSQNNVGVINIKSKMDQLIRHFKLD